VPDVANHRRFSFGIRGLLAIVAGFAIILSAWHRLVRWPSMTITGADIKQAKVIELETDDYPHYLKVRIFGRIDGRATITDPWGTTTVIGPGEFDIPVSNEYYSEHATIKYSPTIVTSGSLTIQYDFVGNF
jgi:hypothetical protein